MPLPQLQTGGVDVSNTLANIMQMRRAKLAEEKQNALLGLQTEKLELEREALKREADPTVVETKNALKVHELNQKKAAAEQEHLKKVKESLSGVGDFINKVDTSSPEQWDKTLALTMKTFPDVADLLKLTLLPSSAFYKKKDVTIDGQNISGFPLTEGIEQGEWDGGLLKKHINRWNLTKEDTLKRDMNNLEPSMETKPVWNRKDPSIKVLVGVNKNQPKFSLKDAGLQDSDWTMQDPNDAKAPPRETFGVKQKDGSIKNIVHEWSREKGWKPVPGVEPERKPKTLYSTEQGFLPEEEAKGKLPFRQEPKDTTRTYLNGKGQVLIQKTDGGAFYVVGENNTLTSATIADQVGLRNPSSSEEDMLAKLGNLQVEDKIKELEAKRGVKKSAGTGETVVSEPGKKKVVAPTARPYDAYR